MGRDQRAADRDRRNAEFWAGFDLAPPATVDERCHCGRPATWHSSRASRLEVDEWFCDEHVPL